ncbi:type II toxin-antitoxin system HicB family antitoxin [Candidatus Peregrinibacteria bacterium]|nr:type II toxin-antitoxin system HicB family antitoxin [Candidatus Peregrinibacteria bacterium]
MANTIKIDFNSQIWKEGKMYVAYTRELDISSCGGTKEKAKKNLREAVEGFLEEAERMGTLQNILREGGFVDGEQMWQAPKIFIERLSIAL